MNDNKPKLGPTPTGESWAEPASGSRFRVATAPQRDEPPIPTPSQAEPRPSLKTPIATPATTTARMSRQIPVITEAAARPSVQTPASRPSAQSPATRPTVETVAVRWPAQLSATQANERSPLTGTSGRMPAARPSLGRMESPYAKEYPIELVVVAASTGGPVALSAFLEALPNALPAPVVIVQHMASDFLNGFAQRLQTLTRLRIQKARGGEIIGANQGWLAPGGSHLLVERVNDTLRLKLKDGPAVNGCRPSADETLKSAVEAVGGRLLALVLTGIGRDGRDGCRAVKAAGGRVLVQDSQTSAVSQMPEAVSSERLADGIYPPDELALQVARRLEYGRR